MVLPVLMLCVLSLLTLSPRKHEGIDRKINEYVEVGSTWRLKHKLKYTAIVSALLYYCYSIKLQKMRIHISTVWQSGLVVYKELQCADLFTLILPCKGDEK